MVVKKIRISNHEAVSKNAIQPLFYFDICSRVFQNFRIFEKYFSTKHTVELMNCRTKLFACIIFIVKINIVTCVGQSQPILKTECFNTISGENTMAFLDSIATRNRLIWLGECSHGINELSVLKTEMIEYFHEKHGFNVVVFESSYASCNIINMLKNYTSPFEMLIYSLIGAWRTEALVQLMSYIKSEELKIAGIDPNISGSRINKNMYNIIIGDIEVSDELVKLDSIYMFGYMRPRSEFYNDSTAPINDTIMLYLIKNYLIEGYSQIKNKLIQIKQFDLARSIDSRIHGMTITNFDKSKDFSYFVTSNRRDSLMAENLSYICDSLYPNEKIIIWAHNYHVAKIPYDTKKQFSIYKYLSEKMISESYVLGLFASSGEYATGPGLSEKSKIMVKRKSLESQYKSVTHKCIFYDARTFGNKKLINGIYQINKDCIYQLFDGVIIMNNVSASCLIKKGDYDKQK